MRNFLCCMFVFFSLHVLAQNVSTVENQIVELQAVLAEGKTEKERIEASDQIARIFKEAFGQEDLFEYSFDKLINIGILESGDAQFRLFNWNVLLDSQKFTYRALLLFQDGNYVEFDDALELTTELENRILKPSEWYGALYYELHPVQTRKRTYYTLVGWDGNNSLSNKKVLDALVIDKEQNITLGSDVFQNAGAYLRRRVFEYSNKAVMTLRYIKPKEAIVFDVLEPLQAGLKGQYQFYGPSTMYSGYILQKDGTWRLEETMDMSRPKDAEKGAQFNFPDKPQLDRKRKDINPLTGQ